MASAPGPAASAPGLAFNDEQRDVVVGDRIYGDEHARNEFMLKLGLRRKAQGTWAPPVAAHGGPVARH